MGSLGARANAASSFDGDDPSSYLGWDAFVLNLHSLGLNVLLKELLIVFW